MSAAKRIPPRWLPHDSVLGDIIVPDWLRPFISWWMLRWLFDRYHLCWSGMVTWKMHGESSWSVRRWCLFPYDYCGYYDDEASDEERREAIALACDNSVIFTVSER